MNNSKRYSVAEFQIDMEEINTNDVELYNEVSKNYGFAGSYTNEKVVLRNNLVSNVLDHEEYRYRDSKEKDIVRLAMLFSDQERFDDLYLNGLSVEQIAFAYKTTSDDVMKKIIFDSANKKLEEKNKSFC